jgi:hypothetical protein
VGVARLNIWLSGVGNPCSTFNGKGRITVLDCHGILVWPCGRYLDARGRWEPVPHGRYHNLPFRCGHLEVEVPPGCYWVVSGGVWPAERGIHFNNTTHVGIIEVSCDQTACVKLFNPTLRLCWDWFLVGLRVAAAGGEGPEIARDRVDELERLAEAILEPVERAPIEETAERVLAELTQEESEQE